MKTIAVDFDGTIASYKGFEGKGVFGEPVPGVKEALQFLIEKGYRIIIHTTRSETHSIKEYLNYHSIPFHFINFNPKNIDLGCSLGKPLADVYVDDRAIQFKGDWEYTNLQIQRFIEWWK